MSIFKQKLDKKVKIQIAIICAVIFVLAILLLLDIIFNGPITHFLTNKDEVVAFISSLGFFGPLAFIFLQILQTVAAPIPGSIAGIVGGYIFGWTGIVWTIVGSGIGFLIVFWLSRRFGRSLVEKIINKKHLDKFDYLAKEKGSFIFFLIFLIPGLPDDVACYIAGLTSIPIKRLLLLAIIGRIPAVIMTNMFGAGLGEDSITPVVLIATISALILAIIAIKRDAILKYLQKHRN